MPAPWQMMLVFRSWLAMLSAAEDRVDSTVKQAEGTSGGQVPEAGSFC